MKKGKTNGLDKIPELKEMKEIHGFFQEARGLMFRTRKNARALLFHFENPVKLKIHSCFVWFSFIAIWIDENNKIIQKKIIRPWKISIVPKVPFKKLIEIPINEFYRREIQELLRLE